MMVWSLAIFIFGFTSDRFFYPALAVMLITGLFNAMMNAPAGAIFQSVVAKDMQVRFHSIYGSLITMMVPVALLIAGPAADAIGLRTVWWVSGGVMFLAPGRILFRELLNLENRKQEEATVEETSPFVPNLKMRVAGRWFRLSISDVHSI
jgi:MFS family permease